MRKCNKCLELKPLEEFKTERGYVCSECQKKGLNERRKKYYRNNPERIKECRRRYVANLSGERLAEYRRKATENALRWSRRNMKTVIARNKQWLAKNADKMRELSRKHTKEITVGYLAKNYNLTVKQIRENKDLEETLKAMILTKRIQKKIKKHENNN